MQWFCNGPWHPCGEGLSRKGWSWRTFTNRVAAASQEAIKDLGTNGGGIFNVNSAHPFENPTTWTNWLEIFLLLVISFALPRTFGRMVGDNRQGHAIVSIMALLAIISVGVTQWAELSHLGTVPQAIGQAMEGRDVRFGTSKSAMFAHANRRHAQNPGRCLAALGLT